MLFPTIHRLAPPPPRLRPLGPAASHRPTPSPCCARLANPTRSHVVAQSASVPTVADLWGPPISCRCRLLPGLLLPHSVVIFASGSIALAFKSHRSPHHEDRLALLPETLVPPVGSRCQVTESKRRSLCHRKSSSSDFVAASELSPTLSPRTSSPHHVLRNAYFADLENPSRLHCHHCPCRSAASTLVADCHVHR